MNEKKKVPWWRDSITLCEMTRSYLPYCMNSLIFLFFLVYFQNSVFFILTQTDLLNSFLYLAWLSLILEICTKQISQLWIFMPVSCVFVSRNVLPVAPGCVLLKGQGGVFFCSLAPCVSQMWMADSIRVPLEAFLSCRLCPSKGRVGYWSRSPWVLKHCGHFTLTTQTSSSVVNSVLPNIIKKVWSAE